MNYYQGYRGNSRFGFGAFAMPQMVKTLILINIGVFLLQTIADGLLSPVYLQAESGGMFIQGVGRVIPISRIDSWFALNPTMILGKLMVWQLFTYMFMHANLFHIFINMLFLWVFGAELERTWGSRQFLRYYIVCGIGGGLFHLIFFNSSPIPVVGASGAVYGLLMAFGLMFPDRIITMFLFFILPIQMRAKYLVLIFGGFSVLGGIGNLFGNEGGLAHLAHLGGMIVGYFYLRRRLPFNKFFTYLRAKNWQRKMEAERRQREDTQRLREEVDSILDKINEVGYENLTAKEKKILKDASRHLSQE